MFAILVDLDGTIYDSAPGIIGSYQHALRCLGAECPPAEDLNWVVGPPLRRSFPKLIGPGQDVEEAVRLYREHYPQNGLLGGTVYHGMHEALTLFMPFRLACSSARRSHRVLQSGSSSTSALGTCSSGFTERTWKASTMTRVCSSSTSSGWSRSIPHAWL
jgi:beta-phosphoglucomutase-like phosphatase (HAD superfamily)